MKGREDRGRDRVVGGRPCPGLGVVTQYIFPVVPGADWTASVTTQIMRPMVGTSQALLLAVAIFVGSHFFLSSLAVRQPLIKSIGQGGFRVLYSIVAVATLSWVIIAYQDAPYLELWRPRAELHMVPLLVMPFASIFVTAGLTTPSVTAVGGERLTETSKPAAGIVTVTRHPVLWGFGLWSLSHLVANGDVASVMLFGGMTVLAFGGMWHIDHRRRDTLYAAWAPVALSTSVMPFLAALQGRTRIDWAGIGFRRTGAGLVLYAALIGLHDLLGVPVWPL